MWCHSMYIIECAIVKGKRRRTVQWVIIYWSSTHTLSPAHSGMWAIKHSIRGYKYVGHVNHYSLIIFHIMCRIIPTNSIEGFYILKLLQARSYVKICRICVYKHAWWNYGYHVECFSLTIFYIAKNVHRRNNCPGDRIQDNYIKM